MPENKEKVTPVTEATSKANPRAHAAGSAPAGEPGSSPIIVVDLGVKSKARIRRLRKGRGRLLADVVKTVDLLRADGEIEGAAQIVVVVVRQKPDLNLWPWAG
jgi:Family of unknown function (DUF6200)